jgi:hypothetical protein
MDVSKVKLLVILSSFQQTTLAVLSLLFSTLNLQSLKLNKGVIVARTLGNNLVLVHDSNP